MDIETIVTWIFRGIVLLIGGGFLWFMFILIPYRIVLDAIQVLIGRPFGFGWIPVAAEMRPEKPDEQGKPIPPEGDYRVAVYTVDDREYRMPYFRRVKKEYLTLYVKKQSPRVIWTPGCDDRKTALAGFLMITALWTGLVFSGILIYNAIRS